VRLPGTDALRMALQVPLRNPGRSALTALGLAIGVGAFIAMVSFGQGARSSVVSQFETLGSNLLRLRPHTGQSDTQPRPLSLADVQALRRESTTLAGVVPHAVTSAEVVWRGRDHRMQARGTIPGFEKMQNYPIAAGGFFDEHDMAQRAKVCMLGETTVRELFGTQDPLGETITVNGSLTCRVIGLFGTRGASISGTDMDDLLMMPLTTFETYLGMPEGLSVVELRPKGPGLLAATQHEVESIMRRRHDIPPGGADDFQIISPDSVTKVAGQVADILTGLLAGIAAVSLLVGGIGIMNIQLVAVAERTHEIGIRLAIGGAPDQILRQFLAEALVLAAIGSAAGVALGVGVSMGVANAMGWPAATSPAIVIGSALFGVAVGTFFGWVPARRAAALDPVDALRRE
jgi:putative ABC transport system permease protein